MVSAGESWYSKLHSFVANVYTLLQFLQLICVLAVKKGFQIKIKLKENKNKIHLRK